MLELSNGCICCSINNDLVDAIVACCSGARRVDHLILETTGLADPLPVALTFLRPEFRDRLRLDSIVTAADAENFSLDLFDSEPAAQPAALRRYHPAQQRRSGRRGGGWTTVEAKDPYDQRTRPGIMRTTRSEVPLALDPGRRPVPQEELGAIS